MSRIKLHNGVEIEPDTVVNAEFWPSGTSARRGLMGESPDTYTADTLVITMKPNVRGNEIVGPEARRIADDLEAAGVRVLRA